MAHTYRQREQAAPGAARQQSQRKSESLDRAWPPPHPPDYRQHNSKFPREADDPHGSLENRAAAYGASRKAGLAAHV